MADIPNRGELEREYARAMSKILKRLSGSLLEAMGDPPKIENLTDAFWDAQTREAMSVLIPFGEQIFLDAAKRIMVNSPVGVEWDVIHEQATEWARNYSFKLVTDIRTKEMRFLRNAVSRYYSDGQTIGQLEKKLGQRYDPIRAEMIAVTEVTRAAAQGEMETLRELQALGFQMIPIWKTNNDEIVRRCPICWPRNNQPMGQGWSEPPPGHPRCRCWIDLILPKK